MWIISLDLYNNPVKEAGKYFITMFMAINSRHKALGCYVTEPQPVIMTFWGNPHSARHTTHCFTMFCHISFYEPLKDVPPLPRLRRLERVSDLPAH